MKTITKKTVKALTPATSITTVASVELYEKTIKVAKSKKQPTQDADHIFAPDGVTRVSAEFNTAAKAAVGDGDETMKLQGALDTKATSARVMCRILWPRFLLEPQMTPVEAFRTLVALGYLPKNALPGSSEAEREANRALRPLIVNGRHFLFTSLLDTFPKTVADREAAALRRATEKASSGTAKSTKTVASTETKGTTDTVSTPVHVTSTCKKFMESVPSDLQKSDLLKQIAKILGFTLEGFKATKQPEAALV